MNTKEKSAVKLFKRNTTLIIILILIALLSLFIMLITEAKGDFKNSMVVNVLGRQRMLTQAMAKDSNRIYSLHQAMENSSINQELVSDMKDSLASTISSLKKSRDEYDKEYDTISKGYILKDGERIDFKYELDTLVPIFNSSGKLWSGFKDALEVIIIEKENTPAFIEAVNYINDNSDKLLNYSDDITSVVVQSVRSRSLFVIRLSIALSVVSLLLLIVIFINMYKKLFLPIKQLYKNMAEVGITDLTIETTKSDSKELMTVFSEVRSVFEKLNSLIILIENLNKNVPFKEVLNQIYNTFSDFLPYSHIGVALLDEDGRTIRASYGVSEKRHGNLKKRLLGYTVDIRSTSLENILLTGKERVINDLEEYLMGKTVGEHNKILLEEGIRSSITFPLKQNDKPIGIIFFSSNEKNVYKKEHIEFLRTLANSIILGLEKSILMDDMIIGSVQALAGLAERRDPETGEHLKRMRIYSKIMAELLSKQKKYEDIIDVEYINNIERFSPLHDIGKVGIRDDILLKPGKLTGDEFAIMKTHTIYGAWVLNVAEESIQKRGRGIFKIGIEIAEGHHEKWDGSGYPNGKAGEEIPLSARIVAVADVLDALTSKRPYKEAYTFEDSCSIIVENSGKHFDPNIIDLFEKNKGIFIKAYDEFRNKGML